MLSHTAVLPSLRDLILVATAAAAAVFHPVSAQSQETSPGSMQEVGAGGTEFAVRSVILLITDGGGVSHWTLARRALGDDLAVASMPVTALVDTRSTEDRVTDSAAGATAYATGNRSYNRGIAMSPGCADDHAGPCEPLPTLLEEAEKLGKSTGLITTTAMVDATPASFAAHVEHRYDDWDEIAPQMLRSGVDVLIGGGRDDFDGSSGEDANFLNRICGRADCALSAEELRALAPSDRRLVALLAEGEMPPSPERELKLAEMTRVALDRLSRNPEGFFLMVENEGTDSYSHDNRDAAAITAEIVEMDRAVGAALDFARTHPETLVVVTADHETGGLSVYRRGGEISLRYTSGNHTDALVPLFAEGPGAQAFSGLLDNEEVGRALWRLLLGYEPRTVSQD